MIVSNFLSWDGGWVRKLPRLQHLRFRFRERDRNAKEWQWCWLKAKPQREQRSGQRAGSGCLRCSPVHGGPAFGNLLPPGRTRFAGLLTVPQWGATRFTFSRGGGSPRRAPACGRLNLHVSLESLPVTATVASFVKFNGTRSRKPLALCGVFTESCVVRTVRTCRCDLGRLTS